MSEIKRVALTTLEPQKVNDKVIKKLYKTVRISVILPESNEDNCPEYNYKDQLAAVVKKKVKPIKEPIGLENGLDPYGDNDEDVKRIALEMEAKYGSGVTKKKRKERKDDYADIGMGYDESDSFIDNTDGYDEIIPKNVTTLHGGFYVNSGALEFKTDDEASSNASSSASSSSGTSSASESEGEDKQKPKNRKRILETSADSDSDTANPAQKEKKLRVQSPTASMQQAIKKKLFSTSKIQVKKRRPIDPLKKTVKDLLREKREDLNMTVPDELKTVEDNIEKESSKENKKPMNITSVTDAIESVLKQVIEENYDTNQSKTSIDVVPNAVVSHNKFDPQISQSKDKDKQNLTRLEKEEIMKLPDNLPSDIEAIISKLKEAALNYKGEGKKAFFTHDVNTLLLNLEKKSKIISKSSRVKVYEHLAQYVNCTKDTLIRRARILDLEDHERRLKLLQTKLKDCIEEIMPTLEENYQLESQKVIQKKFSKENETNEDLEALKMPRRKFIWTEETKKLLKDAVSVKKRCLILEGKYKDNVLEQQLVDYLRTHIQPLWPEGWMYLNAIKKILNRMQDHSNSSANSSSTSIKSSKHSNLSITPVTNGKSNPEKPEITNSITVTKVVNNNEVIVLDGSKVISKSLEIDHVSPDVKEIEEITEIPENEQTKSNESLPKVDFTTLPKKSDVFKPYVDDPQFSHAKIHFNDTDKIRTYQKTQKQNEMFKPYADEVIPDKPKIATYEDIPQYSDKEKFVGRSYVEIDRHTLLEKEKQSGQLNQEKDKMSGHSYSEKKRPGGHSYQEKDEQGGHSYHEKDKHAVHSSQEKDKHGGHSYREKEKHGGHSYNEKDKHGGHSYREKDKHGGHSYQEKDKHGGHSYQEKDKHGGHSFREKDKHGGHSYREKNKHGGHSYHDKDKYSGHSYNDKEKSSSHSAKENPGSTVHNYIKKDKYAAHTYSVRDEQVSLAYPEIHNPNTYAEKEKSTSHSYSDKHRSHSYSEKDLHSSHNYTDKDKHNSHVYIDKHTSDLYADKHSEKDKKLEEEIPINRPEITPQLDIIPHAEKLPSLPMPMEKPTDLSKFQMFKPYSDTPKSLSDDLAAYQPKDVNCYTPKEERHHRNVEMTKSLPLEPSKFSNNSFVPPGEFTSSRCDASSSKHRISSTNSLQVGNSINEVSSIMDDSDVIIKNLPPKEDKKETQIGLKPTTHCQGVKRKLLETYARTSNEMNSTNYYSATVPKHSEYVTSTPLVTSKSEGDGQKDIQMVMENLKALQKLSCSPAKNDNSSSSPVSVIAYNKNFTSSKTSSSHGHSNRNDNSRGDFTGGFQEEFQKAFISSLQQMAASNNKSSYNNGS